MNFVFAGVYLQLAKLTTKVAPVLPIALLILPIDKLWPCRHSALCVRICQTVDQRGVLIVLNVLTLPLQAQLHLEPWQYTSACTCV